MTDDRVQESSSVGVPARSATVKDFARSELFERTFQEGMELVEETAAYLDGSGRQESKLLSRNAALAYASESMRLTTRLMQVASWLLVQRAVREGDMAPAAACEDRYRLNAEDVSRDADAARGELPRGLTGLADRFGSIEAGKDADLVLWSGDPLETTTVARMVMIRGVEQPLTARNRALRDRYIGSVVAK